MKLFTLCSALSLLFAGCVYTHLAESPPEPIQPQKQSLLGTFVAETETLIVRESAGKIEIGRNESDLQLFAHRFSSHGDSIFFGFANRRQKSTPDSNYAIRHRHDTLFLARWLSMQDSIPNHFIEIKGTRKNFVRVAPPSGSVRPFRLTPIRPIDQLRTDALAAAPPVESGEFQPAVLVDLATVDTSIHFDIRYASENNFLGAQFYSSARAFLQRPAAEAVRRASDRLRKIGFGLLVHDAYRPWYVTKMFWDATPEHLRDIYVANPLRGSRHNRGCAIDLTLYDLSTGTPVEMVSGYDEFSDRASADYPGGTSQQRWHRKVLREVMEAEGFLQYSGEWWHYDFNEYKHYRIGTKTFEELIPQ